jgi:hypothetical protein
MRDPKRLQRAAVETMHVRTDPERPHIHYVSGKSGVYLVNTEKDACTCPDFRHRILKARRAGNKNAQCKHQIKVGSKPSALKALALYATAENTEAIR